MTQARRASPTREFPSPDSPALAGELRGALSRYGRAPKRCRFCGGAFGMFVARMRACGRCGRALV